MMTCKYCNQHTNQIKAGHSRSGKQRYKCKSCLRTYTVNKLIGSISISSREVAIGTINNHKNKLSSLEICAGGGGQALGLEQAGFHHSALVEIDNAACGTLRLNRPLWNVIQTDLKDFDATPFKGVDLLSGGVPCPPFSVAGKRLGIQDERNLFDDAIRLVGECNPKAVMLENVRGFLDRNFAEYRLKITREVEAQGYKTFWKLLNSADFGVPQSRIRAVFVALKEEYAEHFMWPSPSSPKEATVGDVLFEEMSSNGWALANEWKVRANGIAPTLVGGSKKHGGADLGPTRAKKAWALMGVDAHGVADNPPDINFVGSPRLTVKMASLIQGFPSDWQFFGKKTPAYRQVGNAFPPPVAKAVGIAIANALRFETSSIAKQIENNLCQNNSAQKQNYELIF